MGNTKRYSQEQVESERLVVSLTTAVKEAKGLKSEDGENPEYDRALWELVARLFPEIGVPTGERAEDIRKEQSE